MTEDGMQNEECRVQNDRPPVVCLVRDLLFYSKIRAAAESAGIHLKSVRDPAKLGVEIGTGLIVDLNQPDALAAAAAWRERTGRAVIGFVSHVDTETIQKAREAGIDRILARSQFEQSLSTLLNHLSDQNRQS